MLIALPIGQEGEGTVKEQSSDDPLRLQAHCGFKTVELFVLFCSHNYTSIDELLISFYTLTKTRPLKIPSYDCSPLGIHRVAESMAICGHLW